MTLKEIAIFKRFMAQHELRMNFIKKYRKSIGLTRNPESIEQYFSNVEPQNVILSGVKAFKPNEAMGYDFWQSVNNTWQSYYHKMIASHSVEHYEASDLIGYFASLRENWDKEKPWVYEPIALAKVRYGLINPEEAVLNEEEDDAEKAAIEQDEPADIKEEDDPLADFDFLDLPTPLNVRLKADEVSLNFNSNSYKITFNRFTTEYIKKAGMTFARLAKNKSGDICLILNRHEGTKLSKSTYNNGARENITINSKEITTKLRTLLNIRADYSVLVIQQLASTSDYMIYKLSKQ
jgi:hypothetical protein